MDSKAESILALLQHRVGGFIGNENAGPLATALGIILFSYLLYQVRRSLI
jgi:hypothetical protein